MRAKFSLPRLRGLAVTATAVLALILGGAGAAGAATTSASTPHTVASQATPTAIAPHAAADRAFTLGPVQSFTTEEACVIWGEGEFPPGSIYLGYVVVGTFCEYGPGEPPLVGNWWNLFVVVENTCPADSTAGPPAVKAC